MNAQQKRERILGRLKSVRPLCHSDGPETERVASRGLDNEAALFAVLMYVVGKGGKGVTSDEARRWYNPESNTGRARLHQLYDLGLVERDDATRLTVNGKPALVHTATQEVQEALTT